MEFRNNSLVAKKQQQQNYCLQQYHNDITIKFVCKNYDSKLIKMIQKASLEETREEGDTDYSDVTHSGF